VTTGTKKENDNVNALLKIAVGVCIVFAVGNFIGAVRQHIPPFSEGQCLAVQDAPIEVKILENHVVAGYSVIAVNSLMGDRVGAAPFAQLRNPLLKKIECP